MKDNPEKIIALKALDLAKDYLSIVTWLGAGVGIILVMLYTVREGIPFPIQSAAQTASTIVISLVFAAQTVGVILISGFLVFVPGEFVTWVWGRAKKNGNGLPAGFWLLAMLWLFFVILTALGPVGRSNVSPMVFPRLIAMIGIGVVVYSAIKWRVSFQSWPAIAGILVVVLLSLFKGGLIDFSWSEP